MIEYALYMEGGEFIGHIKTPSPLTKGSTVNTEKSWYKVLHATRKDLVGELGVPAIALVKRIN